MSEPEIHEGELQAFVDGELPAARCTPVLAHLGRHPEDLQRVAQYAAQTQELRRRLEALELPQDDPTTVALQRRLAERLARPDYRGWLRRAA